MVKNWRNPATASHGLSGGVGKLQDRQNSKIIHFRCVDMASARERMLGMAACVNVAYQNQFRLIDGTFLN